MGVFNEENLSRGWIHQVAVIEEVIANRNHLLAKVVFMGLKIS